jgi:glucosamine kinase
VAYYLGIDGGGSKTTCAIGDEINLLSVATAGPCNITRVGEAHARESLHRAVREACIAAKIDPLQILHSCIGAAGAGREEVAATLRKIIAEIIPGQTAIIGDMEIALQAAFGAAPGVIVIAGTGSIAYGRDQQGRTARAGGWGFAISDEGSAHWIGRQAVIALIRATDQAFDTEERTASPLFHKISHVWSLSSFKQLFSMANSSPNFAALFPAVLAAADAGDEMAEQILKRAAAELARLASIVLRRLFPKEKPGDQAPVSLAMAGGVFRYSATIREEFYALVRASYAEVTINHDVVDPVIGALALARQPTSRPGDE